MLREPAQGKAKRAGPLRESWRRRRRTEEEAREA